MADKRDKYELTEELFFKLYAVTDYLVAQAVNNLETLTPKEQLEVMLKALPILQKYAEIEKKVNEKVETDNFNLMLKKIKEEVGNN